LATPAAAIEVRIPHGESRQIDVADLVVELARATKTDVARPRGALTVPVVGVGGNLSRKALGDLLGPDARVTIRDNALVVTLSPEQLEPARRTEWETRLKRLAEHVERESQRRLRSGMHARESYEPNNPARPTICLVHGMNSSSEGFVHTIPPLEAAGFGVVVYDYPYNRDLGESSRQFIRDWLEFHRASGERRRWAIVAHSMGALLARAYVEDPQAYAGDVSSLILIAPVNHGSTLAKAQTFLQLLHGVQAVESKKSAAALSHLGDGLGEAAADITPGSAFLKTLNRRPRREGVDYHILAGDVGIVTRDVRQKVESQIASMRRSAGLLGGLTRLAAADMEARLDEVSNGTGDGCVSIASTRLEGVDDHITIHANHAELIRAPLLFRDPGPVACMPYVLRWLESKPKPKPAQSTSPRGSAP
jgi:pimeloyl-ACP methyl ester carboxylesterase